MHTQERPPIAPASMRSTQEGTTWRQGKEHQATTVAQTRDHGGLAWDGGDSVEGDCQDLLLG